MAPTSLFPLSSTLRAPGLPITHDVALSTGAALLDSACGRCSLSGASTCQSEDGSTVRAAAPKDNEAHMTGQDVVWHTRHGLIELPPPPAVELGVPQCQAHGAAQRSRRSAHAADVGAESEDMVPEDGSGDAVLLLPPCLLTVCATQLCMVCPGHNVFERIIVSERARHVCVSFLTTPAPRTASSFRAATAPQTRLRRPRR